MKLSPKQEKALLRMLQKFVAGVDDVADRRELVQLMTALEIKLGLGK